MVLSADHIIQTDVLFVIEGTAINGAYFQDIKSNYILPSLEYFSQGPVDERDYGSENTSCLYGIVLYYAADCLPCPSSVTYGPYSSASRLLSVIDRLELVGGKGESHANIAEGLATSLQCLEEMGQKHEPGAPSQRHCILVCNSPPYLLPVMESHIYSGKTVEQLSGIFQERGINLSIISPRKIPELFKIFDKAGGSLSSFQTKNYAKDPRHLVLLKGFSLKEHDINPPTGPPSTQTQHVPTSMPTSLPSPMSNTDSSMASVAPQTVQALMNPVPQGPVFRPSQCITGGMTIPNQPTMGVQMGRTGPMGNPQFPSQPLVGPPGYHQTPASVAMNTRPPPRWTMIQQQRPPTQYQPAGAQSSALIAQLTQPPSAMAGPGAVNQFGQRMEVPATSNPQLNQQQNPLRMSLINQPSGGIQTSLPQSMPVQSPVQQQNATNAPQQTPNVATGPGPSQGNTPGQVGQMREKHIIWQGILEWSEKAKSPNDQQKINRHVPCQVSANSKDGEPELKADSWPQKLIMQLMPKQLIGNIGGTYLKNSKSVLFHPQNCEALESLTKVMSSGFAGCVHFTSVSVPNACDIKVLILLYTAEKRAYLGFIPNDQAAFVDRLRKVIQQQKSSQMMRQGQVAPGSNQINPGGMNAQQNTPAGMTAAAGSPATSQSIGTPQQPGMLMAQANTGMAGPSVPGQQQGPQQGLIGSQTNAPGPRMNLQGIGNVTNQPQPGIAGPIRNQVVGQQNTGQGPGMLGAPQQQRPPIDHIEVARQQNLEKILHLQQTLEAAQQQEAQYKSQLEIMNHMKTQHIQEALNMAQQQEMQYKQMEQEQQKQLRAQIQQMQQQQQQRGPMAPQVSQAGPVGGVVAPGQQRMMRPNVMSNNPGLRHLLQQQQPQYRQQLMGLQSMGNTGPRGPQINQQMNANQNKQFDDVSFDFM